MRDRRECRADYLARMWKAYKFDPFSVAKAVADLGLSQKSLQYYTRDGVELGLLRRFRQGSYTFYQFERRLEALDLLRVGHLIQSAAGLAGMLGDRRDDVAADLAEYVKADKADYKTTPEGRVYFAVDCKEWTEE